MTRRPEAKDENGEKQAQKPAWDDIFDTWEEINLITTDILSVCAPAALMTSLSSFHRLRHSLSDGLE